MKRAWAGRAVIAALWVGLIVAIVSDVSASEGRGTPSASSEAASKAVPSRDRPDFEQELALAYSASAPAKSGSRAFHLRAAATSVQQFDGRMLAVWAYNDQVPGLLYRRDTIDVGMVPIDWGRWMMHCHILEHAEAGMMTEIHVGDR